VHFVQVDSASSTNETSDSGPSAAKKRTLGSILKKKKAMLPKTPHNRIKAEIYNYLSLPINSESDPLDWWKSQHNSYPSLSKVAEKYLCKQCSIRKIA